MLNGSRRAGCRRSSFVIKPVFSFRLPSSGLFGSLRFRTVIRAESWPTGTLQAVRAYELVVGVFDGYESEITWG
jgi:hypothetical protein